MVAFLLVVPRIGTVLAAVDVVGAGCGGAGTGTATGSAADRYRNPCMPSGCPGIEVGIAVAGGVTAAVSRFGGDGEDVPLMPLANEHNASQVRRSAACCSASEAFEFVLPLFPGFLGSGATSRAFSWDSMVGIWTAM